MIAPQKGHQQIWEILRVLAGTHAIADTPLDQMLRLFEPIIGRGMSALVITPSVNPDWIKGLTVLMRHGIYLSALLLDATSFGGNGNIKGVMGALADLGVFAHIISKGYTFEHLTQKRQQRPQYRSLGTGRVIVVSPGVGDEWIPLGQAKGDSS